MTDLERWKTDGLECGWLMPTAPAWKRLPIIRYFRGVYYAIQVARHQSAWTHATGAMHSGYDKWVVYGIHKGQERAPVNAANKRTGS